MGISVTTTQPIPRQSRRGSEPLNQIPFARVKHGSRERGCWGCLCFGRLRSRKGKSQLALRGFTGHVPAIKRVNRGAKISPTTNAVATHMSRQKRQVSSSPRLWRSAPLCRVSSITSAGKDGRQGDQHAVDSDDHHIAFQRSRPSSGRGLSPRYSSASRPARPATPPVAWVGLAMRAPPGRFPCGLPR